MEMTKNEYKKYMGECADKLYKNIGYTMDDYNRDLDAVKILPFDLSVYPAIKDETKKWINILFTEEDKDRKGNYMLRGFTYREYAEADKLNITPEIYSGYSWHGVNDDEMLIFTFCEGDTTLKMFNDKAKYEKEKAETIAWYKEEYGC